MADRPSEARVRLYDEPLPFEPANAPSITGEVARRADGLSKIELRFCHAYTVHYDRARAAIEAGFAPTRAFIVGHKLLQDARVKRQVAVIEADRLRRMKFDGDVFLARELLLASADVNELVESWIPPCRYCWGTNFEFQRTHAEYQEAWEDYMRLPEKRRRGLGAYLPSAGLTILVYDEGGSKLPFDSKGGDGYDPSQPPNPACLNCHGRGNEHPEKGSQPYVRLRDSRHLSEAGRALYAGVRVGPRGIEQLMHDQSAARSRLMTMIGKFLELRAQTGGQSAAPPALDFRMGLVSSVADLLTSDPSSFSDQQLDVLLMSHGVVISDDGSGGEGAARGADPGEAPPPGRVA